MIILKLQNSMEFTKNKNYCKKVIIKNENSVKKLNILKILG